MTTYDVIADETAHLASWRNRYSGDMVSPYLLAKFNANTSFSPTVRQHIVDAYLAYRPLRFLVYWLMDAPTYSTLAELTRALSNSNVYALRALSLLSTVLALLVAARLGAACWDRDLGLWVAGLFLVGPMVQFYAGIGRSYGLVQLTTMLLLYRYVLFIRDGSTRCTPVFVAALIAQSIHASAWFAVFPIVASTAWVQLRRGSTVGSLMRETWWYISASLMILALWFVVSKVSSLSENAASGFDGILKYLPLVSPFGALLGLGETTFHLASAGLFLALLIAGVWATTRPHLRATGVQYVVVSGLVMAAAGAYVAGATPRHLLQYMPVPLLTAAIGARALLGACARGRLFGLAGMTALLGCSAFYPVDGYKLMATTEGRYSEIAHWLQGAMKTEDSWMAWPIYCSHPLYSYASLPEPFLPISRGDMESHVTRRAAMGSLYVLTDEPQARGIAALAALAPVARFQRHGGDFLIYVLAPVTR